MSFPRPKPLPVALRPREERYAHVVQRMNERGGVLWDAARVAALETKIKFVRTQANLGKPVAAILPTKISETKEGHTHHYRVMIAGEPHTFIWSQICRGLISYAGRGEIKEDLPLAKQLPSQDPIAGIPLGCSRSGDLSGCSEGST